LKEIIQLCGNAIARGRKPTFGLALLPLVLDPSRDDVDQTC